MHSIPIGIDEVDQIQIVGDSLYVGIGAACDTGDPADASLTVLATGFAGPADVVRDPFGRLLVADLYAGSVWLLEPPITPCSDGLDNDGQTGIDFDGGASLDQDLDGLHRSRVRSGDARGHGGRYPVRGPAVEEHRRLGQRPPLRSRLRARASGAGARPAARAQAALSRSGPGGTPEAHRPPGFPRIAFNRIKFIYFK